MPLFLPPSCSHSTVIGIGAREWWRLAVSDAIPDLLMLSVERRVTTRIRPRAVARPREARLLDRRTTGAVDVEREYCLECRPSSSEVPGVERDSFVREPSTSAQSRSRNPSLERRVSLPWRTQLPCGFDHTDSHRGSGRSRCGQLDSMPYDRMTFSSSCTGSGCCGSSSRPPSPPSPITSAGRVWARRIVRSTPNVPSARGCFSSRAGCCGR